MAALVSPVSNADPPPASLRQQESSVHPHHNSLLFLGFNQDHGRFACGTAQGFRVYDCHPFKEAACRESSYHEGHGGIAYVELLFRSHIFALVGGGPTPRYPSNKVMIWDDHQCCCIGELSFRSQVRSVKLRRDRIVVALERKVFVYNFADLKLLLQIDTVANPKGLCAISSTSNPVILACPGLIKGQVRLDFHGTKKPKFISAHDSGLACLVLTLDGGLLATASSKGTLIRVFNTLDGSLLQEVFCQDILVQSGRSVSSGFLKRSSQLWHSVQNILFLLLAPMEASIGAPLIQYKERLWHSRSMFLS